MLVGSVGCHGKGRPRHPAEVPLENELASLTWARRGEQVKQLTSQPQGSVSEVVFGLGYLPAAQIPRGILTL